MFILFNTRGVSYIEPKECYCVFATKVNKIGPSTTKLHVGQGGYDGLVMALFDPNLFYVFSVCSDV